MSAGGRGSGPEAPERARRARASLARMLADAPGLVGVGIGADEGGGPEILVLVREEGCEAARRAPAEHGGCRVRVEVSGPPRRLRG